MFEISSESKRVTATLPKTMRAVVLDGAGPPEALHIAEVPVPPLPREHVMIALDFASVGSWDAKLRSGDWGPVAPGTVLGADGAGTIAAVGEDVDEFRVGDRVYAYSYQNANGGFYAEYVSVRADHAAPVPPQLREPIAGALPCVALTALAAVDAVGDIRETTVLVFGGSGGVGSLAVWLSAVRKATVVATGRPDTHEYLRRLGAAHAIDPNSRYRDDDIMSAAPRGFDAAIATANSDALPAFLTHLRSGAPLAYPDGVEPEPIAERHPVLVVNGESNRKTWTELNETIGTREIPLEVTVFEFDDVVAAHRRIEQGHVVGKLVLRIR